MEYVTNSLFIMLVASYSWATVKFFRGGEAKIKGLYLILSSSMLASYAPAVIGKEAELRVAMASFLLFSTSLALFWWAVITARQLPYAASAPDNFITTGPWKFIRHPFYSSYLLCWIGILARNTNLIWNVPIFCSLMAFYFFVSKKEEAYLIETYPGYNNYKKQVGRFCIKIST